MQDILINFLKMASKVAGKRNTKATFQSNLTQGSQSKATEVDVTRDDDDVYYQSGGAALCDMLKLRYKQIKTCSVERKDILCQEITVLQAVNTKDKSGISGYLQYNDKGYM